MGIGRRAFMKISSLAVVGLSIDPLQAVVTNNDIYLNKKLGLYFEKPKDWGFVSVKDFGKLRDAQILGNGFDDHKEEIWEDLGDPICIITKYHQDLPEYKGVFSLTITVNVTHKTEFKDFEFENVEELIELSRAGAARILKDFRVVKTYPTYQISDCNFYEYDTEYTFEHIELPKPISVQLKVIKAEHGDFYYDFNCHQSKEVDQLASTEFNFFKNNIKLI